MEKYRLYVGEYCQVNEKTKYSFYDPTTSRMLAFAKSKPGADFRVMKEADQKHLSTRERLWLSRTRLSVAMSNTSQSANELAHNMNKLMDVLEEELRKEREALNEDAAEEPMEQPQKIE